MGCTAASSASVYEDENGEQIHDGRNNLGVIAEPAAHRAGGERECGYEFWTLLDERLQLARKALMTRITP